MALVVKMTDFQDRFKNKQTDKYKIKKTTHSDFTIKMLTYVKKIFSINGKKAELCIQNTV